MEFYQFESPIGPLALGAEEDALVRLYLPGTPVPRLMPRQTPLFLRARRQLEEYFAGTRHTFDLPVDPEGTPFQHAVWAALGDIPWGVTRTYGDIARAVGRPRGAQAVGQALGRNPLPILIPCHRVVRSGGTLGGFGAPLSVKAALLAVEGVQLSVC